MVNKDDVKVCKEFVCLIDGDYVFSRMTPSKTIDTLDLFIDYVMGQKDTNEMLDGAEEIEFLESVKYFIYNKRRKK